MSAERLVPPLDPTSAAFTWWAYLPSSEQGVLSLGRTPAEAFQVLQRQLEVAFPWSEPEPDDTVADFVDENLDLYGPAVLVCAFARNELEAWRGWLAISGWEPEEGLRFWRHVFPAPAGEDLVAEEVHELAARRGGS